MTTPLEPRGGSPQQDHANSGSASPIGFRSARAVPALGTEHTAAMPAGLKPRVLGESAEGTPGATASLGDGVVPGTGDSSSPGEPSAWPCVEVGEPGNVMETESGLEPPDGSGTNSKPPSGAPKRPILAASLIIGALLTAIPLTMTGMESRPHNAQQAPASAAGTAMQDDGEQPTPGAFTSASTQPNAGTSGVSPVPTPSDSGAAAVAPPSSTPAFGGVNNVMLRNLITRMCVAVPGSTTGPPSGPVMESTCGAFGSVNERWSLQIQSGGTSFVIRNEHDGQCLDLAAGTPQAGTLVIETPCGGSPLTTQLWSLDDEGSGTHWIRNVASNGQCLGVTGNPPNARYFQLDLDTCDLGHDDRWFWPQNGN